MQSVQPDQQARERYGRSRWKDIGLPEWLFNHDLDEPEKGLTPAVLAIANDQETARAKAAEGKAVADDRMKRMMDVLRETVEG